MKSRGFDPEKLGLKRQREPTPAKWVGSERVTRGRAARPREKEFEKQCRPFALLKAGSEVFRA